MNIEVERVDGADGKVQLCWKTKDQSAVHGKDYMGGEVITSGDVQYQGVIY